MKLKNANFVCEKMQLRDIKEAFDTKTPLNTAYDMIRDGYLHKISDRYYRPTEKLYEAITPTNIVLTEHQRRFLSNNSHFYWKDLVAVFDTELIPKAFLKKNYIKLDESKRYKKSDTLENLLADGEEVVILK